MVRKILLGCGIASSVLYVVSDVIGNLLYESYTYTDNTWSELFAIGAPTRSLMLSLNIIPGTLLGAAFAVGVWTSATPKRTAARITGAMLLGYTASGTAAQLFFPMKTREALAAGERNLPSAGYGLRVYAARKAVPVLHVRNNPPARRVWRFVGPAGWPS